MVLPFTGECNSQVAGFLRNQWQVCSGIPGPPGLDSGRCLPAIPVGSGRFPPESWSGRWQVCSGISGRFGLEYSYYYCM